MLNYSKSRHVGKKSYFRKHCLILVSLVLVSFNVLAQGFWIKIGYMPVNRYGHTVNELNGKIYVVGGSDYELSTKLSATALINDMSTGIWSQIPLYNNVSRAAHSSCVVDGKLYVVGGNDGTTTVATMEMFNPDSGKWISKTSMPTDRGLATCAVINNKIYIIGECVESLTI